MWSCLRESENDNGKLSKTVQQHRAALLSPDTSTLDYIYLNAHYRASFIIAVLRLGLEFDFVSGWSVVMHTYLYQFPLSL